MSTYLKTRSQMYKNNWHIEVDKDTNESLLDGRIPVSYDIVLQMSINGDALIDRVEGNKVYYKIPSYYSKETHERYQEYLSGELKRLNEERKNKSIEELCGKLALATFILASIIWILMHI